MTPAFQVVFALSLVLLSLWCFFSGVAARTTLHQNEFLLQNDSLRNGDAMLYMQNSCNLVLYNGNKVVWATNTSGKASRSCWAELEQNGNFAVFGDNGTILWSSNSGGIVSKYQLVLLDSGDFAIFWSCPKIWSPNIGKKAVVVELEVDHEHKPTWSGDTIDHHDQV